MRDMGYSELADAKRTEETHTFKIHSNTSGENGPERILPQGLGRLGKLVIDVLTPKGWT